MLYSSGHRLCLAVIVAAITTSSLSAEAESKFSIATFQADVTIPMGHPCMGGGISPAKEVADPLLAKGFVLSGGDKPFVMVGFDWCEIRGVAYDNWRQALAEATGTEPSRVLITSDHVHDAPVMDPEAEKLLRDMEATGAWKDLPPPDAKAAIQIAEVCWPKFNDEAIGRVVGAMRESLKKPRRITHYGIGKARVDRVASNRRYVKPDGTVAYNRMSRCTDPVAQAADDGPIDPFLRTLSFWSGDECVCALHSYAVHPMSTYGAGKVSSDFVGMARELLQKEQPDVLQIYASGCSGNVTAGKYNDGSPGTKAVLAGRLKDAMVASLKDTERHALTRIGFNKSLMPLGIRNMAGFTEDSLHYRLAHEPRPFGRAEPAMGLSWYERVKSGHQIEVPVLDFDKAQLMLLPAESYVEFQLHAQELRPESFVMVMGYGECGPGYIPIERAWREKDSNLHDWCWVGPGSEEIMKKAIREALGKE